MLIWRVDEDNPLVDKFTEAPVVVFIYTNPSHRADFIRPLPRMAAPEIKAEVKIKNGKSSRGSQHPQASLYMD
jgi:hypothetical protein